MPAVRFSNTYRASPFRAPMYLEKNHKKYVKDCLSYQNNSEVYTSKKIKDTHIIEQSSNLIPLMMYIVMAQNC